ncbi:MAG: dephospho-CoA kinase [Planctomycetota bacterium]|nr:dephospho-CoA kinase [Planctomycetota bacterium]
MAERVVVGLVGGIASGKTAVAEAFRDLGATVVNADSEAHGVLELPRVRRAVKERYGRDVFSPNGKVDRAALAARVFGSEKEVRFINRLVHPEVLKRMRLRLRGSGVRRPGAGRPRAREVVVIDAPLLMETGIDALCDHIIFIRAPANARRRRTARDRRWPAGELSKREAFQISLKKKLEHADFIVDNGTSLFNTRKQVEKLFRRIRFSATATT